MYPGACGLSESMADGSAAEKTAVSSGAGLLRRSAGSAQTAQSTHEVAMSERKRECAMQTEHTPLLSIIVPIYNVEEYLPECLNSIFAQTFTDYELILVDDGTYG